MNVQKSDKWLTWSWLAVLVVLGISSPAQENIQYSQGNVGETMSNSLSIPMMSYKGRGIDLPVALTYSSSLWRIDNLRTICAASPCSNYQTVTQAIYAEHSTAGWKSSLDLPKIEWPKVDDVYHSTGAAVSYYTGGGGTRIRRLTIHMPDGSSHDLRENDSPHTGGVDTSGTFYAVDGSRLRYDSTDADTGTLYLPDGTRYILDAGSGTMIDRNGNTLTYSVSTRQWTDTMGRVIGMPIPASPAATDYTYQLPGLDGVNGGLQTYTFKWRELEDSLVSGAGPIRRMASHYLPQPASAPTDFGGSNYPQPQPTPSATPLFVSEFADEAGYLTFVVGKGQAQAALFNPIVLQEIVLPDSSTYKFSYNVYGEIEKIIYPTGAFETYQMGAVGGSYVLSTPYHQAERGVLNKKLSENGLGTDLLEWVYSKDEVGTGGWGNGQEGAVRYRVVAPDTTCSEVYKLKIPAPIHYGPFYREFWDFDFVDPRNGATVETRAYAASQTACAGALMRRELTSYSRTVNNIITLPNGWQIYAYRNIRPVKKTTILFEGTGSALAQTTTYTYDATYEYSTGLDRTQERTYHFAVIGNTSAQSDTIDEISPGNLARMSQTTFHSSSTYRNANILGIPTVVKVFDNSEINIVSQSEMVYDECPTYCVAAGKALPTSSRTWDSTKGTDPANPNYYLVTHATFDQWGNRTVATDAKGFATTTTYDSTYHAFPESVTSPIPNIDPNNIRGSTAAFTSYTSYDATTGLVSSTTDTNGQTTTMEYNDPLLRPTKVTAPNGHQTITEYGEGTSESTRWVKVRSQIDASFWSEAISKYDGLGRTYLTEKIDSQGSIYTETEYDAMGRVERSTNPYKTGDTKQWTVPEYDDLSRTKKVNSPDATNVQITYALSTTSPVGTKKTITDQAGKKRTGITDALGNMVRVIEDPEASALVTDYQFDTLGNLRKTTQGAQIRYFNYDSLGRVLRAKQVEQDVNSQLALPAADPITNNNSWTVKYTYDDNSNIATTTDAKNTTITATYDRLNRITLRNYGDSTPDVDFYYDGQGLGGVPNYSKGKTTRVYSTVSDARNTSFDTMGRTLTSQQITDGQTYPFVYTYNLSGALIEETYPSGRVVKNTLNADGELQQVQSKKNSTAGYWTYADAFSYNAAGAVTKMQLGNGLWETAAYDPERMQVTQIGLGVTDSTQNLLKLEFRYGSWNGGTLDESKNNGSMAEQKITVPTVGSNPGFTATQAYTYDSLNRIQVAEEKVSAATTWKQTFSYDRYGNRTFDAGNTTTLGGCATAVCNPTISSTNNRLSSTGYLFDATGNLTQDATGQRFGYDAENHQKEFFAANNGGSTPDATYHYDGEGRRVKKINGTEVTIFVYDAGGILTAEYSTTVAPVELAKVAYMTTDHLGSPRIITDANGAVSSRKDFTAFGEAVASSQRVGGTNGNGYDPPSVRQDYTGYQKDNESGLEFAQARYFNPQHGRFTSIDPLVASATIKNPQSFNRYSYVLNSPYKFTDPLGLMPMGGGGCGRGRCVQVQGDNWWGDNMPMQLTTAKSEPPPLPRPQTEDEQNAIARLGQLIAAETTRIGLPGPFVLGLPRMALTVYKTVSELGLALTAARDAIIGAIEALRPGEKNVGLQTAVNAINAIGDQSYANANPMQAPGGPYEGNKCNVFVAMAVSTASAGKLGSSNGYPLSGGMFPAANYLGDSRDVQKLNNLPIVSDGSLNIGDIVGYRHRNASSQNMGHSAIYIGGGAVVYAGGGSNGAPIPNSLRALNTSMASTDRLSVTVRRYAGK